MGNATIYLNPEAFDTSAKMLMGRHSAGESFLKGYLTHAKVDRYVFWNPANQPTDKLLQLCERLAPVSYPVTWLRREDRLGLRDLGVANFPSPHLTWESWQRYQIDPRAYAICGITHTTATAKVMDAIGGMLTAPVEPYDALICTSRAVRASVETQLEAVKDDLKYRLGATRIANPMLATIPLGINVADFAVSEEDRIAWRRELGISSDTVVALYVGRFNAHAKMNPVPMAQALEEAAKRTGKKIAWVLAGWAEGETGPVFHAAARAACPSVQYIELDGRRPEVRFSIWSVGDFFLSLSDNIQETFGLTPLEAMAAGIPNVVSDWDGYRDTVRHGIDGFRIATYAPAPGQGRDLAYRHANEWASYGAYVSSAAQATAVDVGDAAKAIAELVKNPDLRARMGAAAKRRAAEIFDWSVVIPQYQSLWAEQNAIRRAAPPPPPRPRNLHGNPNRLDPFLLFGGYPTEWLSDATVVALSDGMTWELANEVLSSPLASNPAFAVPTKAEAEALIRLLTKCRHTSVGALLANAPTNRRVQLRRGVIWLAKYNVIKIFGRSGDISV